MVVANIEKIGSDRIGAVRLPCGHIIDKEKCIQKEASLH
jgi:hypothetical protein